jgi:hypothetical protein
LHLSISEIDEEEGGDDDMWTGDGGFGERERVYLRHRREFIGEMNKRRYEDWGVENMTLKTSQADYRGDVRNAVDRAMPNLERGLCTL